MRFAYPMQKVQDWITQQWVIARGREIEPEAHPWLMGPFGNLEPIGTDFISRFAEKEGLVVQKEGAKRGIIPSIGLLNLPVADLVRLSPAVVGFYENTRCYNLNFSVTWNPLFKSFGGLLNRLFSRRLNQLQVPTKNIPRAEPISSEIIHLMDPVTQEVKYTFWLRALASDGPVIYSGVYGICTLPSGATCIKAVFPLPNGNATVLMKPSVGLKGELILDSSGNRFGDAGFYFLLKDGGGRYHAQFVRSFRDHLVIGVQNNVIVAQQLLTLWRQKVLQFNYEITGPIPL